jgi:exoribonuclease R
VDSANAKEVDDAVSVFTDPEGRDWLYIHVADITRFIEPHSYVDEAARIRGSSIFLPDVTFPMLPDPLVKVSELRSGFVRFANTLCSTAVNELTFPTASTCS